MVLNTDKRKGTEKMFRKLVIESENTTNKFSKNPFLYHCSISIKLNFNSEEMDKLFSIHETIRQFLK